jgi:polysaccharide pyruvyl transferase WcaK-like protein
MSPHSLMLLSVEQRVSATSSAAQTIGRLINERDATVVLVPHDFRPHASDPSMLADIYSQLPEDARGRVLLAQGPYAAADVKQLCVHFDFVLTGRMHLMIAALGRDVPVLAMEYQGKFAGALAHFGLGQEQLMEPADVCSAEELHQRVCKQLDSLGSTRAQIEKFRPVVQHMASATLLLKLGQQI